MQSCMQGTICRDDRSRQHGVTVQRLTEKLMHPLFGRYNSDFTGGNLTNFGLDLAIFLATRGDIPTHQPISLINPPMHSVINLIIVFFYGTSVLLFIYYQYTPALIDVISCMCVDDACCYACHLSGPYAWLGYGWMGCGCGWEHNGHFPALFTSCSIYTSSQCKSGIHTLLHCAADGLTHLHCSGKMPCDIYQRPAALDLDYGTPTALCSETAPGSAVFSRNWSKSRVTVDCNTYTSHIRML